MPELPNLEGQPGWVVVVVVGLFVLGGLGVAYIRSAGQDDDTEPGLADRGAATLSADGGHAAVGETLRAALGHLAETAHREALEAETERARATELQIRLETCSGELLVVRHQLERCEHERDRRTA